MVQHYLKQSLATSTQKTYAAGKHRYYRYCLAANKPAIPTSENMLCEFVAHTAQEGLKYQTIKTYLLAVRNWQVLSGMGDPFRSDLSLLEYVLRDQARNREGPPMERLPITPDILLKVRVILERNRMSFDNIMLWAVYCTAFFGFLRSAGLTVPSQAAFDPGYHLSFGDILFDTPKTPPPSRSGLKR